MSMVGAAEEGAQFSAMENHQAVDMPTQPKMTKQYSVSNMLLVEFIGVVLFVFIGSLSSFKSVDANMVTHAAFAHGLSIFVLVASFGHISGGHFNPAVTLAVGLAGGIQRSLIIPYWLVQLAGGFVGALLVRVVTQKMEYDSIIGGATIMPNSELWYQGSMVEAILTIFLTQTVLHCAVGSKDNVLAPLAIGFTVALDIFGAGSISGASMNPARSLGPAIAATIFTDPMNMSMIWTTHYIYWVGPAVGAVISALIFKRVES